MRVVCAISCNTENERGTGVSVCDVDAEFVYMVENSFTLLFMVGLICVGCARGTSRTLAPALVLV